AGVGSAIGTEAPTQKNQAITAGTRAPQAGLAPGAEEIIGLNRLLAGGTAPTFPDGALPGLFFQTLSVGLGQRQLGSKDEVDEEPREVEQSDEQRGGRLEPGIGAAGVYVAEDPADRC